MDTISRRTFIKGLLASAASVAALAYLRIEFSSLESKVEKILQRRLDYLELDPEALRQFASELVARTGTDFHRQIEEAAAQGGGTHDDAVATAVEVRVVSQFLMSSDFFLNGADVEKKVGYRFFYAPYEHPCANPFAVLT